MPTSVTALGISGLLVGKSFQLGSSPLTIGRSPDASISLVSDAGVSRNHAQLYLQGDEPFVVDLGSSNGTMVNGQRLTGPKLLADGDEVAIGPHSLRIQVHSGQSLGQSPATGSMPVCLVCGGNQVLALRSVTAAGVSSTVGTSINVGGAHVLGGGPNLVGGSVGTSRSVTKTDLAKMLAMPFSPPKEEPYIDKAASCMGCLTFLVSSFLLSLAFANEQRTWFAIVIGLVLGVLVTFVVQGANKARNQVAEAEHIRKQDEAQQVYLQHKAAYERSLYCPQCHSVFDPITGRNAKPEQLSTIL